MEVLSELIYFNPGNSFTIFDRSNKRFFLLILNALYLEVCIKKTQSKQFENGEEAIHLAWAGDLALTKCAFQNLVREDTFSCLFNLILSIIIA